VGVWRLNPVCCSVLQCVAVCCSVSSRFRCSALQCVAVCCPRCGCLTSNYFQVNECVAVCCSVLQCVAVCCSVLQCVAVGVHVLHRTTSKSISRLNITNLANSAGSDGCVMKILSHCNTLHQTTAHCNTAAESSECHEINQFCRWCQLCHLHLITL